MIAFDQKHCPWKKKNLTLVYMCKAECYSFLCIIHVLCTFLLLKCKQVAVQTRLPGSMHYNPQALCVNKGNTLGIEMTHYSGMLWNVVFCLKWTWVVVEKMRTICTHGCTVWIADEWMIGKFNLSDIVRITEYGNIKYSTKSKPLGM